METGIFSLRPLYTVYVSSATPTSVSTLTSAMFGPSDPNSSPTLSVLPQRGLGDFLHVGTGVEV